MGETYSRSVIRNILLNWHELESVGLESESELLLILKCDIEMAIKQSRKLRREEICERGELYTILSEGEWVLRPESNSGISEEVVTAVVEELYEILNVGGLL